MRITPRIRLCQSPALHRELLCLPGSPLRAASLSPGSAPLPRSLRLTPELSPSPSAHSVVLDSVVAVVNNHAILASDIDDEIRLSVLDPGRAGSAVLTRKRALEQLIGRALIQQQIREEDMQAAEPSQAEVDARLAEIRKELPACVRQTAPPMPDGRHS